MSTWLLSLSDPARLLYGLTFLVAALVCGAGVWRVRTWDDSEVRWGLGTLFLLGGAWALTHVGVLTAPAPNLKMGFYLTGLLIGGGTVGAWLYVCSAYTGRSVHRNWWVRSIMLVVLGGLACALLTNPLHEWVVAEWQAGRRWGLQVAPRPLYWGAVGIGYALATGGWGAVVGSLRRVRTETRLVMGLTGAFVLPALLNGIAYASSIPLVLGHEPIGVAAFALGSLFVWRRQFWTVGRIMKTSDPGIGVGPNGQVRGYNQKAETMLPALRSQDALGASLADVCPPFAAALAQNQESFDLKQEDGRHYYQVDASRWGAPDEDERLITLTDTTAQALRRQKENVEHRFLSATVDQVREAVLITEAAPLEEPGPRILYANDAFEKMTGYREEEVCGKTPRILQGPETERDVLDDLREALERGEEWQGQTANYRKDGTKYVVEWTITPIRGLDGSIDYWASVQRNVTEEQRRKDRLQRSRERYQSLFEQAVDAILVHDLEGRIREVNPQAASLFGCDAETLVGQSLTDLHPPGEEEVAQDKLDALRAGDPYRTVARYERADGSIFWGDLSANATDIVGETVARTMIRDATDWIAAEQNLERQNDLFEKAQEIAQVGAWEYDVERDEGILTDQVYRIHGLPPSHEMPPEKSIQSYHPEDRPKIREAFRRAVEEGDSYDLELRLHSADGEERWVRTSGEPQTDSETDEVVRVRGTMQDITDQKRRENALQDRQNKVEALYQATNRLLRATSEEEVAEFLVQLVSETLDYPGTTIRFVRDHQLVPFRVPSMVQRHMPERPAYDLDGDSPAAQAYRTGQTQAFDDLSTDHPGMDRGDIRATAYVPMGAHGVISVGSLEVGGISSFDRHLIEVLAAYATVVLNRLHREETLREAKEEAEEADRMKTVFLANLSHEIRTPLTSIIGFAEEIGDQMASLDEQDPEERLDALDLPTLSRFARLIRESGKRLLETLDGVLNLSKLEAGEMGLRSDPIDLSAEVETVAQEFEARAETAGVELRVDVSDDGPWAWGDGKGLEMILRNLVSNALKYTDEGGTVWIRTRHETTPAEAPADAPGDGVSVLEVEDTGIGIDSEQVDELFEPFRQASEGLTRQYEGTGLGLAITRKAVREMGGTIDVETEKGKGTCFIVRLREAEEVDTAERVTS